MLFFATVGSLWLSRNELIFNLKEQDFGSLFLLILTRLYVWLKALSSDFPYCALDLLLSTDGLVRWTNLKGLRPLVTWSPPAFHGLKWNVNGSSIGKPGPAGVEVFFVIIRVWCNVCFLCLLE